jgi:prephenate dehydrogenase
MKKTVAIVGVGLIGGSLGRALRRTGKYRVMGLGRRASSLRAAKRLGAVDTFSTDFSDVAVADIVMICSPVDTIAPLFKRLLPHLKPGAIVTDAGSVKGSILRAIARIPKPASIYFVGGHPLAGSHKTGVKASNFRLFEGSTVVLIPGPQAAMKPLKSLWNAVGAKIQFMSARDHDRAVALISHLPHVLAHTMVHAFASRSDRKRLLPLLAGSFRDVTRVASADAEQWSQILRANAPAVEEAIGQFRNQLTRLQKNLRRPALRSHLRKSQHVRRPLFNGH